MPALALERVLKSDSRKNEKVFAYLPFLDGLRALSIFAVLTFHTGGPIGHYAFKYGGWAGVDAFFVISGFLISGILLQERDRTGSIKLKDFYKRRILRLVPAFALWLLVTSIYRYVNHTFLRSGWFSSFIYVRLWSRFWPGNGLRF